jgi:hypothetical protein
MSWYALAIITLICFILAFQALVYILGALFSFAARKRLRVKGLIGAVLTVLTVLLLRP